MELYNLGLNAITIGLIGTIFFTCLQFWGLLRQNQKIWQNKSGASVSVPFFAFGICGYFAGFLKGLSDHSIAMSFNVVIGLVMLPIFIGLWKYKGFSWLEKLETFGLLTLIIIDAALPYKDYFWFGIAGIQVLSMIAQPYEIIKKKSSGVVELRMLLAFYIANWFWVIYGFATHDLLLQIIAIAVSLILTVTIVVWWNYRNVLPKPKLQLAKYD